ncbi:DUF2256 domain-containing protein [Gallaecimonas pentaromativorans]|uniref:DUF2256 domain-containing protein n=1 Tax=Gallaecimonas pentaromativorans TaxID=584787 RepID=UPI0009FB84E3|nr:DUF2256 domain-containing protein [Gallaecimonas pentaromativorans]MED5525576.1 DUF2256 domain-containing protein [Pseudomonadota bacterium]
MAAHRKQRPVKVCPVCGLTFQWRRKYTDSWDQVKYCSERCRRSRKCRGSC